MAPILLLLVAAVSLAAGCSGGASSTADDGDLGERAPTTTTTTIPDTADLVQSACDDALVESDTGNVLSDQMTEISGLVSSRAHPDVLWAINDSGDKARLFAMTPAGRLAASFVLEGVTATDWEDIAIGPGPVPGQHYLYVADTGNSASDRSQFGIVRVPEPAVNAGDEERLDEPLTGAEVFAIVYPDRARDAEAILVDPTDGDVLLVHKSWSGSGEAMVFRATLGATPTTLEHVSTLPLAPGAQVTAADVAPAGDAIAIRTYGEVLLYPRTVDTPLPAAFGGSPCAVAVTGEQQGESVTFAADGASLLTVSEGADQPLHNLAP